tara:strand:- start:17610 stop:18248 length:639 start_codon:yes stop_codon:yes gene_type:complete
MPAKTTELEAVNTILSTVGEPPINSFTGAQGADATIARNILTEISREVQSRGWHFNTFYDQTLSPNTSNEIVLADEVLRVDNDPTSQSSTPISTLGGSVETRTVIQRGNKLYDKKNNSFTFSSAVRVSLVLLSNFEEMPEPARRYVTIRAARTFQDRMVGGQKSHMFTMQDEMQALSVLKEFEGDTADYTIFDHSDVFTTINRKSAIRGAGY